MTNPEKRIRIELTDEQKRQIKEVAGKDVAALELTAEELENRIAASYSFGVS
jgi:hypothetical protein